MIGLYFFFLLIVWICLAGWLSTRITRKLPDSPRRYFIRLVLFAVLLPLPLIDEIIGKWQFERLCQENSTVYIAPDAKGRTVYLADMLSDEVVKGALVPIRTQKWQHVDATTGEIIVSYNNLQARGGWFIRTFFGGLATRPLLFKGSFQPPNLYADLKKIGINCCIDRPKFNNGGSQ